MWLRAILCDSSSHPATEKPKCKTSLPEQIYFFAPFPWILCQAQFQPLKFQPHIQLLVNYVSSSQLLRHPNIPTFPHKPTFPLPPKQPTKPYLSPTRPSLPHSSPTLNPHLLLQILQPFTENQPVVMLPHW